jgi:hypothetical protein
MKQRTKQEQSKVHVCYRLPADVLEAIQKRKEQTFLTTRAIVELALRKYLFGK